MTVSLKFSLRLLALLLGAIGALWASVHAVEFVERRNTEALKAALAQDGYDWADVAADGLIVRMTGEAPDEATRFRALRSAGTVVNPANLQDRMSVTQAQPPQLPEFRLEILRQGRNVTLLGLVPQLSGGESPVPEMAAARAPGTEISDLLSTATAAPPEGWPAALDAALSAIGEMEAARIVLRDNTLSVKGRVGDRDAAAALRQRLQEALPDGFEMQLDLDVPRPVLSPFVTRFSLDAAGGRFDACAASSDTGRARILAAARAAGAAAEAADCIVALGAPDQRWDAAVADALTILADLGAGTLTASDLTFTLDPGPQRSAEAIGRAADDLRAALPDPFDVKLPAGISGNAPAVAEGSAAFTATRSPEGLTQVRGDVASAKAREVVRSFAAARFPAEGLHTALRPMPGLPDDWQVRILAGLDAFSALDRGRLRVEPSMLLIHGATGDPGLSAQLAALLTEALGPSEPFTLDIAYVEAFDPVAALPSPEDCIARIRDIQSRSKITFAPGSTELDTDALRIVRRIADILRDCAGVEIVIAGHTDSQGGEDMNRDLSEARANAVLNALIGERVLTSTLTALGLGESEPIAANDTEEGREANRRIEFRLRYPMQGPPMPDPAPDDVDDDAGDAPAEETANGPE